VANPCADSAACYSQHQIKANQPFTSPPQVALTSGILWSAQLIHRRTMGLSLSSIPSAAIVSLRPPFVVPHTFRGDLAGSGDGSDALIAVSEKGMLNTINTLRTLGWDIPPGTSKRSSLASRVAINFSSETISIVGANASIAPGLTLVRSINSPLPVTAPEHSKDAVWVYDCSKDRHCPLDEYLGRVSHATDGLPYPCRSCGKLNRPMYKKDIYVVVRGFEIGIIQGLVRCTSLPHILLLTDFLFIGGTCHQSCEAPWGVRRRTRNQEVCISYLR
jgi:hypothetical protein